MAEFRRLGRAFDTAEAGSEVPVHTEAAIRLLRLIRDRRSLKLLWQDPHHGANARAVYPVRQR
ncbi:MAG: hypothetical protein F4Y62_12555 [Rhodospirillaceae bacterium]|nr:hypothetical protein [Rhodospirillaceae bacterium]